MHHKYTVNITDITIKLVQAYTSNPWLCMMFWEGIFLIL